MYLKYILVYLFFTWEGRVYILNIESKTDTPTQTHSLVGSP